MKLRKLASVAAMGLGLSIAAGSAQSALLYAFQDDDIDFVVRNGVAVTTGPIAVGDIFVSVVETTWSIDGVDALPAGQELTGVAAVRLVSITCNGVPGACVNANPAIGGLGTLYTYAAVTGGLNSILALGTNTGASVADGDAGEGAAIALFLNGTSGAGGDLDLILNQDLLNGATNCTSLANCIDQASLGTEFQVDGFKADPDEFWSAIQTNPNGGDLAAVLAANKTAPIATVVVALSNFTNLYGQVGFLNYQTGVYCGTPGYIADGCVQVSGLASLTGGQGLGTPTVPGNGAVAHSDFDFQKYVVAVPEPGTLALLALGLLGLGTRLRRRRA